jgi:flagellar biosynthesis protein FlhB
MSDSSAQDRHLPASQRKLKKAREEGQVARSRDLGHFVAIAVCGAMLVVVAPRLTDWLKQTLVQALRFDAAAVHNTGFMGEHLLQMTIRLLWVVLPFCGVMMAAALAAGLAIGGWNWTLKPLVPKFGKLNPLTGLPGLLSKDKLTDALKGSALALLLGTIGALYLKSHVDEFAGLLALPLPAALQQTANAMLGGLGLLLAMKIRDLAKDSQVPVFQSPVLAHFFTFLHAADTQRRRAGRNNRTHERHGNCPEPIRPRSEARRTGTTQPAALAAVAVGHV